MNILNISHINKNFGPKKVLKDISFDFLSGECLALLGPSGSGKSTLIKLISGLENPSSGKICLKGEILWGDGKVVPPEKRGIGLVPQDLALFPHFTVSENISFGLHKKSKKEKEKIVRKMVHLFNLQGLEKKMPHEISGGEKQRVAMARALAPQPKILLLDEPFNGLDYQLKKSLISEMKKIFKSQKTSVIFVTHDKEDAFQLSDRILLIKEGKVQQIGSPLEIYESPLDSWVATFLGKGNFFSGGRLKSLIELGLVQDQDLLKEVKSLLVRPHGIILEKSTSDKGVGRVRKIEFFGEVFHYDIDCEHLGQIKATTSDRSQLSLGDRVELKITNYCCLN